MCYYFLIRRTHWRPNFLNCSKNEDFVRYAPAIFKMTFTLTYDLDLGFFLMCYYFSMRQTHWWPIFFELLQKWRFNRVRRLLKWPWPWSMTLHTDFSKCATTSRWDEHTGGRIFSNPSINKDFIGYAVFWPLKVKRFDLGKNSCHFRTQRAKGYLHADFERNHYSNLNTNIFRLSDLDLDLWPWPWIFLMCYFSMRRTHWWPNFLNCSKNEDFVGYGDF